MHGAVCICVCGVYLSFLFLVAPVTGKELRATRLVFLEQESMQTSANPMAQQQEVPPKADVL